MTEPEINRTDDAIPDDETIETTLAMLRYAIEAVADIVLTERLRNALMDLGGIDPGTDRVIVDDIDPDAIEAVTINGDKVNPARNALYYVRTQEPAASVAGVDTRAMTYDVIALWVTMATRWDKLTSWGCLAAARRAKIIVNEVEATSRELGIVPGANPDVDEIIGAEVSRIHIVRKIILRTIPIVAGLEPAPDGCGGVSISLINDYVPPGLVRYVRPALAHLAMEGRVRMRPAESGATLVTLADKTFSESAKDGGADS